MSGGCCAPAGRAPAGMSAPPPPSAGRWAALGVGGLVAANAMSLALAINLSPPPPSARFIVQAGLAVSALAVGGLVGRRLIREGWRALMSRRLAFEHLFLSAILGAFGFSVASMARGDGPVYFEVVALLWMLYDLGDIVKARSRAHALTRIEALLPSRKLRFATRVAEAGRLETVPVGRVRVGDRVVVDPGERAPIDGVVRAGTAQVDGRIVTGEAHPRRVESGATVRAGEGVLDGRIELEVTAELGERSVDRLETAVDAALRRPSAVRLEAERLVRWLLPVAAGTALVAGLGWWAGGDVERGATSALAVLLVACPCAAGFAVPLASWLGLLRLSELGLVARAEGALERLGTVGTVVFDKTGTLTTGEGRLLELTMTPGCPVSRERLLAGLASLERTQRHPVASAFRNASPEEGSPPRDLTLLPGRGLAGTVDGVRLTVARASRDDDPWVRRVEITVDGSLAAVARIGEERRAGLGPALAELNELGLRTVLLTGDDRRRSRDFGIAEVHARCLPEDKLSIVRRLRGEGGPLAFVGDGFNDAAALAEADVSIAVASGAELIRGIADFAWVSDDLRALPAAIARGRRVRSTLRGALRYAVAYNAVGMALAALGGLHPVVAAILMVASSTTVTWWTVLRLSPDVDPEPRRDPDPAPPTRAFAIERS